MCEQHGAELHIECKCELVQCQSQPGYFSELFQDNLIISEFLQDNLIISEILQDNQVHLLLHEQSFKHILH